MLASVIPNVSACCATLMPERASSTICLCTSTGYLLGIASSSLNAGGFQKPNSAKPGSDHRLRGTQDGSQTLPRDLAHAFPQGEVRSPRRRFSSGGLTALFGHAPERTSNFA